MHRTVRDIGHPVPGPVGPVEHVDGGGHYQDSGAEELRRSQLERRRRGAGRLLMPEKIVASVVGVSLSPSCPPASIAHESPYRPTPACHGSMPQRCPISKKPSAR